ncbi:MAG TPA: GNAT family N-acetyltransferase [Pirellulales bacterium]|nr:GNAT family N-acetyltransferase [Pirellulales bacterium]
MLPGNADRFELVRATAGDHIGIQQFMSVVFPAGGRDAFLASLDDPFYEPADRIVVRHGSQIVGHAHVLKRVMYFGGALIPVAGLAGVGVLPEYRGHGIARALLRAAERTMRADGAIAALLTTRVPHFFRPHGWAVCGRHCYSSAATRDVLAQLSARQVEGCESTLRIRPWRQVELLGLMRLYSQQMAFAYGPFERTEAYWRWRVSRHEFDQIFVAIDGPEYFDWASLDSPIAGYVVMRGRQIVELVVRPGAAALPRVDAFTPSSMPGSSAGGLSVAEQLLARACGEVIERDDRAIQLHASPSDPLHRLLLGAGGTMTHREANDGDVFMVKLLEPGRFVRMTGEACYRRAIDAGLPTRVTLGLCVDGQKHRVSIDRRSARLTRGNLGRSYLTLNSAEFTRLVMGHLDLSQAVEQGRIRSSTRLALDLASALFPRVPCWRPPWDDVVC